MLILDDERFALFEFKLGSVSTKEGEKRLLKIVDLIREHNKDKNKAKIREVEFLSVITPEIWHIHLIVVLKLF